MEDTLTITEDDECTLWVVLVHERTRRELSRKVAAMNWRHDWSAPGTIYSNSAQLLRAYKADGEWCGVVVMGAYRDV